MNRFVKYALTGATAILSAQSYATIYTIGGSPQTIDVLGTIFTAPEVSGSNFTMFAPIASGVGVMLANPDSPLGGIGGTTEDVVGTLDDSKVCFDTGCATFGMTFSTNTLFSGSPWTTSNIRLFGPGTYQFDTCLNDGSSNCLQGGDPTAAATLEVGPGQIGAQVFFDWGGNPNIDVFLLLQPDAIYTRPAQFGGVLVADSRSYELASRDVDGDGNPGSSMVDGPFKGHNAAFSFFLDQSLAVPAEPSMVTTQVGNGGAGAGIIDTAVAAAAVTIDSGIASAANLSFEWNVTTSPKFKDGITDMYPASSAALVTANANGTTSSTFVFNPTNGAIVPGATLIASVRVTNTDNGLSNGATFSMLMGCPADAAPAGQDTDGDGTDDVTEACADSDKDGILEYLDPSSLAPTGVSVDLPSGTVANSDTGMLSTGSLSSISADSAGNIGSSIAVSFDAIGVTDDAVALSCVGGCFDFTVTGGSVAGAGTSASVVVPLSTPVPERALYKKVSGGAWSEFDASGSLDSVNSAASVAGVCPAPGDAAYSNGLVVGDDCLQITIEDNGPNDADSNAGTIADPGGVAQAPAPVIKGPPSADIDALIGNVNYAFIFAFASLLGLFRFRKMK